MPSAPPPVVDAGPARALAAVPQDEFFARQRIGSAGLPNPNALIENLSCGVIEVLAGVRDLEQLARWMSQPVYQHLLRRTVLAARGRATRRQPVRRPQIQVAAKRVTFPADGVVEATVILHGAHRVRAIAIRLEGLDSRWRATAIHVL